jgi:uncharacterized paraquat-inducible protein A
MRCRICDGLLVRVRREPLERLFWAAAFLCRNCGKRFRQPRPFLSRYSQCPRCGTEQVKRAWRHDPADKLSLHPLSLLQVLFFAPLHYCPYCRLQFFDLRKPMHKHKAQ